MQIVVVFMNPVAVTVETASHRAQKRLHFESHAMLQQRPHPRLDERIWRANDRTVNISCANRHNFWLLVRLDLILGNV
jgi:hypothetical protein